MYQRLVIPLDGSAIAAQALSEATMIAQRANLPLHLVRVVDLARLDWASGYGLGIRVAVPPRLADEVFTATAELAETAAQLRAKGLPVTTEVRQGDVIAELQRVAQPGDLYLLATHGRSGMTRWLLGSVAEALVRRSVVPVLIVRALVPSRATDRVRTATAVPVLAAQPA